MRLFGFYIPGTRDYDAEIRDLQARIERLQTELAERAAALAQKDAQLRAARTQIAALQQPPTPPEPKRMPVPEPPPVRDISPKLTIELVPQTCWFSNVRNHIPKDEWDRLRKPVFQKAGNRCEVCGGRGPKWPVECHEIFEYDDARHVQTLVRMVALCPACHSVKHYGLAQVKGLEQQAFAHLCKVNGWTSEVGHRYVKEQFAIWRQRSQHQWDVDLSLLQRDYGITVQEESAEERTERADAFYREKLDERRRSGRGGYNLD